jgi:aspartyl-tRNA(Asn)/glutamyl-tRNA(Gln) amidotransferase subunit A
MSDLARLGLCEAAASVREGSVRAEVLVEACLDRIERLQPVLNCFTRIDAAAARQAARAVDAAVKAGRSLGPLAGVPLAHKDMFYRQGQICGCGSKIRRDFVPDHTSTALARLDAAGAIELGRLNMAEFAMGPTGHNPHTGRCRNPWNPDHISGGSSSGSGAAVAASLAFGALGSDTGGSVRLPAAMCGVVGVKPTQGRVSRYGAMPLSHSLDCIGVLARSVRDCARLLSVVAGADPLDGAASRQPLPDYESGLDEARHPGALAGLTIGVPGRCYYDDLDGEVAALLARSRAALEARGAKIVDVAIADHNALGELANAVFLPEAAALHLPWLRRRPGDYSAQVRARLLAGLGVPATLYLEARQARARALERMLAETFAACDVLHVPALKLPVPSAAETDIGGGGAMAEVIGRLSAATRPLNYLGLPGLVVPIGFTANGLPQAMQLIARPFREKLLFRVGAAYEAGEGRRWADRFDGIKA